jgi:hypothetical protein
VGEVAVSGIREGKTSGGLVGTTGVSPAGMAEGVVALGVQAAIARINIKMIAINRFTI